MCLLTITSWLILFYTFGELLWISFLNKINMGNLFHLGRSVFSFLYFWKKNAQAFQLQSAVALNGSYFSFLKTKSTHVAMHQWCLIIFLANLQIILLIGQIFPERCYFSLLLAIKWYLNCKKMLFISPADQLSGRNGKSCLVAALDQVVVSCPPVVLVLKYSYN